MTFSTLQAVIFGMIAPSRDYTFEPGESSCNSVPYVLGSYEVCSCFLDTSHFVLVARSLLEWVCSHTSPLAVGDVCSVLPSNNIELRSAFSVSHISANHHNLRLVQGGSTPVDRGCHSNCTVTPMCCSREEEISYLRDWAPANLLPLWAKASLGFPSSHCISCCPAQCCLHSDPVGMSWIRSKG